MTEKEFKQLLGYIGVVRNALVMQNWTVQLHREAPDDSSAWAETWQVANHHVLNVRVDPKLWEQSPQIIRNTIVHELIHAQHRDVSLLWEACTLNNDDIAVTQAKSWDVDFKMFMERFVSWTTDRIEDSVPLPSMTARYRLEKGLLLLPESSSPSDPTKVA